MRSIARFVAGLFMVFCAIIASGNAYSTFQPSWGNDGVRYWAILPDLAEHGVVFAILAIVAGLFAIRGRWMTHVARVVAVLLMVVCAMLAGMHVQSMVVGWTALGVLYPQAIERAVMWCAVAIVSGLFAVRGRILPQAAARP